MKTGHLNLLQRTQQCRPLSISMLKVKPGTVVPNSYLYGLYTHSRLRVNTPPAAGGLRPQTFPDSGFRRLLTPVAGALIGSPCGISTSAKHVAIGGQPAFGRPPLTGFQKASSGISPVLQA